MGIELDGKGELHFVASHEHAGEEPAMILDRSLLHALRTAGAVHGWGSHVFVEVDRTLAAIAESEGQSLEAGEVQKPPRVDALVWSFLQLNGFHSEEGGTRFHLTGPGRNKQFRFGGLTCQGLPDAIVAESATGDIVFLVVDKTARWKSHDGHLAQVFGRSLSVLYNYFQKYPDRHGEKTVYAIRLLNHCVTFFALTANRTQVDECAAGAQLTEKMRFVHDIPAPEGPGTGKPVSWEHVGRDLKSPMERKNVVEKIANLRKMLSK
jgi:hypothetical protein